MERLSCGRWQDIGVIPTHSVKLKSLVLCQCTVHAVWDDGQDCTSTARHTDSRSLLLQRLFGSVERTLERSAVSCAVIAERSARLSVKRNDVGQQSGSGTQGRKVGVVS